MVGGKGTRVGVIGGKGTRVWVVGRRVLECSVPEWDSHQLTWFGRFTVDLVPECIPLGA